MPGPQTGLGSAAEDRKARLAHLKSLKRKQPTPDTAPGDGGDETEPQPPARNEDEMQDEPESISANILSGRNYDHTTRGPKLGFESLPQEAADGQTLEEQAAAVELEVRAQAASDAQEENAGIDLVKLRPKKPNWDLRRELDRKLEPLNVKTHNAIAQIVRERMAEEAKRERAEKGGGGDGEAVGLDGKEFVEGLRAREAEDAEEERREREELEELNQQ